MLSKKMEVNDIKTIHILFKQAKITEIFNLFEQKIIDGENLNLDLFNRLLIELEKENKIKKLLKIYKKSLNQIIINEKTSTIIIRSFLIINKIKSAFKELKKLDSKEIKKRTLIPFFDYYYKNEDLENLYNFYQDYLKNKFILDSDDYQKLLSLIFINDNKDKCISLLEDINGKKVNIDTENEGSFYKSKLILEEDRKCKNCDEKIKQVALNFEEINILTENLENKYIIGEKNTEKFKQFKSFIKSNKFKLILDGANILFFGERKITFNSYIRLNLIIEKIIKKNKKEKVLLIIHQRHVDFLNKNFSKEKAGKILEMIKKWKQNIIIYFTPYKMNDDWFILYASIQNKNSRVISNDLFRDHKFQISEEIDFEDIFNKWSENNKITFDFENKKYNAKNLKLVYPLEYSLRVQKNNLSYHIPSNNNEWICIN
jgi:hypothetical protein